MLAAAVHPEDPGAGPEQLGCWYPDLGDGSAAVTVTTARCPARALPPGTWAMGGLRPPAMGRTRPILA